MLTATETVEAAHKRSIENYQKDEHFRRRVQQVVAHVMQAPRYDPEDIRPRDVYDAVVEATATLLRLVYEDDGELSNLKAERDAYRKIAEDALNFTPPPMFVAIKP